MMNPPMPTLSSVRTRIRVDKFMACDPGAGVGVGVGVDPALRNTPPPAVPANAVDAESIAIDQTFPLAGINPLLIVVNALPWSFLVAPAGILVFALARRALAGGWFRFRFDQAMQFAVALERDPAVVEYAER